jgi:hypothetical protein
VVVGALGGTASRWLIDVASGIPPLQLVHGLSCVGFAAVVAVVYLVAVALGAAIRYVAIRRGLEDLPTGT